MTTFEKLTKKIKEDTGIEVENIRRLYTGINMKSSGAWCWIAKKKGSKMEVGSETHATDLLKCKKLSFTSGFGFNEIEIFGS